MSLGAGDPAPPLQRARHTVQDADRIDLSTADRPLTEQQMEACHNVIAQSKHVRIKLLPNHGIDDAGSLRGFAVEASNEDKASVLPLSPAMFACTCTYEIRASTAEPFNRDAVRLFTDTAATRALLKQCAADLRDADDAPATFDCIPDEQRQAHDSVFTPLAGRDQRPWTESIPSKMGLYHAHVRTTSKDKREHKLYIIVTGCLTHAAEELHALWQDTGEHITCETFLQSEEVHWLRSATVRNNSRVAARIADALGLPCTPVRDPHAAARVHMLMPTSTTMHADMQLAPNRRVRLVNAGCFTEHTHNGVAFDMFSSEGVWVFRGPPDHQAYNVFGAQFAATAHGGVFPTSTVHFGSHFPARQRANVTRSEARDYLFPGEDFFRTLQTLGFNRNHGILNLMPIAVCEIP